MTPHDRAKRPTTREVEGRRIAPGLRASGEFTYSVIEATGAWSGRERRTARRIRTHLREGSLRESRGRAIVDCRIRDFCHHGARLQLDRERPLPRVFVLRDASQSRTFLANLVWQKGRDAGVRLTPLTD